MLLLKYSYVRILRRIKEETMANIKSQKKRALTNAKKNLANTAEKSRLKTAIKSVLNAVNNNDLEKASKAFSDCTCLLDKAVSHNLKHKNYASRQKSRLAKAVATIKKAA